jgi:uncharacterized membrane protein YoaK (UPF0700 family)
VKVAPFAGACGGANATAPCPGLAVPRGRGLAVPRGRGLAVPRAGSTAATTKAREEGVGAIIIDALRRSGGSPPDEAPAAAIRYRDSLVVVLTLTTGAMDAVTFLHLGKVFSSVVTGDLALLGVAAGQHQGALAVNGGLALAGYGCGILIGAAFAGTSSQGQPVWPARVTITLAVELALLAAFSGGWLAAAGRPAGASRLALLATGAAAMGVQSTAVRRLGQMSTTYLTSTLTGILTALAIRRWPSEWQRSTGILIAIVVGATLGALAATWSPPLVPAAILVPLAAVVVLSLPAVRSSR